MKYGEQEQDGEEKKEDDDEDEEMEGKRRDKNIMQDSLVVEEVHDSKIGLGPCCYLCSSSFKVFVFFSKKKVKNNIVEIQKDQTS